MTIKLLPLSLLIYFIISCNSNKKNNNNIAEVKIVGAMKNVMWKGDLTNNINLDTISNKNGLYRLGPASNLRGELLINNGKSYVSNVTSDTTMNVNNQFDVSAPFFVYSNVTSWEGEDLSDELKTIQDLDNYLYNKRSNFNRPFTFKLIGQVKDATIHIQDLPEGTSISSPKEAHQGQVNYNLKNEDAKIVGFFSIQHKGVFTHHDSNLHMHLITRDESKMGHLDNLEIGKMKLYLPN